MVIPKRVNCGKMGYPLSFIPMKGVHSIKQANRVLSDQSDFDFYYILFVENMCLSPSFNNEMAQSFERLCLSLQAFLQLGVPDPKSLGSSGSSVSDCNQKDKP